MKSFRWLYLFITGRDYPAKEKQEISLPPPKAPWWMKKGAKLPIQGDEDGKV